MWNALSIQHVAAILLVGMTVSSADRRVAAAEPAQLDVHALLDVPYVSQTPELCGGAAVAMVLRYWGERNVFPEDFAPLVGAGDGGILTGMLVSAVRDRGWQAFVVPEVDETGHARIRSEIDRGRPLIALIEVAPRTYHYVVVVGGTDKDVVLHDPARAPFRVLPWTEFDRAWTATGRWMMLVLPRSGFGVYPGTAPVAPSTPASAVDVARTPCSALVETGIQMALTGDRNEAEERLVAATGLCPNDPATWRELAGLRFTQSRWSDARDLALTAVRLAPDDTYSWQLVATSRSLMGDAMGALTAWNHAGEPRIDTVEIHGAERTRQPVIVRAAGWQPRQLLTPEVFGRALRRLRDLPVASNVRLKYEPVDHGLAKVDVFIDERQLLPRGWMAFAMLGARALVHRELRVDVAGPLGAGDLESIAWRWPAGRPRVALSLVLPSPQWTRGVISIDGSWEQQTYDTTPASSGATIVREERRRVGLHVADWSTSRTRWQAGAALDRLRAYDDVGQRRSDPHDYLAMEGSVERRLSGDRLAVAASGGWWARFAGGDQFGTGGLLAAWRSTADATRPAWSATSEVGVASRVAPLALWQGAGTGHARPGLLRAHPLLNGDTLAGPVFGRELAHSSLEYGQPVGPKLAGLSIAGFVDLARAWRRMNGLDTSPLYADAGIGARVHAPGGSTLRVDVAHGLRGGGTTLSASWSEAWPR